MTMHEQTGRTEHTEHEAAERTEEQELLTGGDSSRFSERWQQIQARFVDDPREAVHDADALVQDVLHRVTRGFDRAFFGRLLSV
jgi:hypothetical protein